MTVRNALKLLGRYGQVQKSDCGEFSLTINGMVISFFGNGGSEPDNNICCINARRMNDHDRPEEDHFAGSYYRNLTQAIKWNITGAR